MEGAEQPLAERVREGVREAAKGEEFNERAESWQCAELKWSRRAVESGAVKSQRRQRQQAWTRLERVKNKNILHIFHFYSQISS